MTNPLPQFENPSSTGILAGDRSMLLKRLSYAVPITSFCFSLQGNLRAHRLCSFGMKLNWGAQSVLHCSWALIQQGGSAPLRGCQAVNSTLKVDLIREEGVFPHAVFASFT